MVGFEYYNPAKIIFGENAQKKLGSLLQAQKTTSLLMVYSGSFVKELGIYQEVKDACEALGIAFSENGEVVPNPSITLVRRLAELGREKKVDFILAVGGGSTVDTAKATALAIP